MNKKLILTSILAIGVTGAAHAAHRTGSFPNDGKMLEDWTYTNAANETNVGVDGGNVNALANYEWIEGALPAGKYLPADTVAGNEYTLEYCTSGNYCAGTGNTLVHYNQSQAQGLTACPDGYGNSAVGSTANTDCYRTCNINNMTTTSNPNGTIANIAHAATLTGNDYYGNGTDTCEPATCETGYQVRPGNADWEVLKAALIRHEYEAGSYSTNNAGISYDDIPSEYGISGERNAFSYKYENQYMLRGHGRCSTTGPASDPWIQGGIINNQHDYHYYTFDTSISGVLVNDLADQTGQNGAIYCYCRVEGYKVPNGDWQTLSAPWVFEGASYDNDATDCANKCAAACLSDLGNDGPDGFGQPADHDEFRHVVANSVERILATCEAKTYNITWADTLAADVTANEAATATYGGNINTPVKIDPAVFQTTQKGKRFIGWTFQQQSNNP